MPSATLLFVGAGTLAEAFAEIAPTHWVRGALALTRTPSRWDTLRSLGFSPVTLDSLNHRFDHAIIALPPSQCPIELYRETLYHLKRLWTGQGRVLFVSSTGVFENPPTERSLDLLKREQMTVESFGDEAYVLRFCGLYHRDRGPHRSSRLRELPDRSVSLLHYRDAARALLLALSCPKPKHNEPWTVSTLNPVSRRWLSAPSPELPENTELRDSSLFRAWTGFEERESILKIFFPERN